MERDKGRARRQEVAEEKAAVAMENTRAIRAALRRRDELAAAQRRREQDALTDATEEADRARHEKAAARPAKAYFAQGKARQGRREKRRTSASRVHSAAQNACGEGWYGSWFLSKQAAVTCSNHGLDAEDIVMALGASGEPRGKRTLELGLNDVTIYWKGSEITHIARVRGKSPAIEQLNPLKLGKHAEERAVQRSVSTAEVETALANPRIKGKHTANGVIVCVGNGTVATVYRKR